MRWLNGSARMPSGRLFASMSMVLMRASVLVSHIATGLLLAKPSPGLIHEIALLLPNYQDVEAVRQDWRTPFLLAALSFWRRTVFRSQEVYPVSLLIDCHRTSAAFGRNVVHSLVFSVHKFHNTQ